MPKITSDRKNISDRKKVSDLKKKAKPKITLSKQIAKTQKVFNQFIRMRDQEQSCIACGKFKIEHASHFYSAGKHTALRFNEDNVHGSCLQCNYFKHGNLIPYRINLEHRIGKERLDLLDGLASRLVHKWSILELQTIENEYKDKIKSGCGRI